MDKSAGTRNKKTVMLQGVNLIDGLTNSFREDVTILVENGIITNIGSKNDVQIPSEAQVLELSGKTVIPGLIDAHLHLSQSGVDDFAKPFAEKMNTKLKRNAYLTLKSGVTTVRNMPGGAGNILLQFREEVKLGREVGPRILASGPALSPPYGYFSLKRFFPPNPLVTSILSKIFGADGLSIDVDTEEEASTVVKKLKQDGVDFIKTVTTGAYIAFIEKDEEFKNDLLKKGIKIHKYQASMKAEVLKKIVEEAHNQGLKVAAHTVSWPEDFKEGVTAGVDSIEHTPLGLIDDETFDLMNKKNTYWVPTAYTFYNWSNFIENPEQYETEEMKELIPEPYHSLGKKSLEKMRKGIESGEDILWSRFYKEVKPFKETYFPTNFKNAMERGVKIVAAVDAGASGAGYVPHGQLYKELELFVEHGMSEFEAIQTATKNPAELLGIEKELGTIEEGKIGDFVILDNNPLTDISSLRKVNSVIKDGVIVYSKNLP